MDKTDIYAQIKMYAKTYWPNKNIERLEWVEIGTSFTLNQSLADILGLAGAPAADFYWVDLEIGAEPGTVAGGAPTIEGGAVGYLVGVAVAPPMRYVRGLRSSLMYFPNGCTTNTLGVSVFGQVIAVHLI